MVFLGGPGISPPQIPRKGCTDLHVKDSHSLSMKTVKEHSNPSFEVEPPDLCPQFGKSWISVPACMGSPWQKRFHHFSSQHSDIPVCDEGVIRLGDGSSRSVSGTFGFWGIPVVQVLVGFVFSQSTHGLYTREGMCLALRGLGLHF